MRVHETLDYNQSDDISLAKGFSTGEPAAVRVITQRHNQRLFRAAWSILGDRTEAEDVVQSSFMKAFSAAAEFEGRSSLSTWLTRIAINEALARKRLLHRQRARLDENSVVILQEYRDKLMRGSTTSLLPDGSLAQQQIRHVLESAVACLSDDFRTVFILRHIEGMSVEEVANSLEIPPATVKSRDFRARRMLKRRLAPELKSALTGSFPFAGADCAAMTNRVLQSICSARAGT
ncbi:MULTISPECIES: RNA polymerase sigma factor [Sphingobium]|uniref:RNA polymerase sigma factor n=1 Tax=Sphingobium agri TaxID=2933566 RepID=A0ABT0E1Q1_9SPHN|nr:MULTISPECIES: RNA polymerase sigma factor [Sphingobium]MCK0533301.1 RNA polymerase sigma factor [Sphingobium agri]QPI73310.1 RNA polymerase sigma factor [Sphingobium sp. Cam5-1]